MKFWATPALLALTLLAISSGCSDPTAFDENIAKGIAEAEPFPLDSEQVSMNINQLGCGATEDLWGTAANIGERSISHLQQKGRDLKFSDDVYSNEAGYSMPYTQVRGKFPLQWDHAISIKDGEDSDTKIVEARVGVKIAHACFDGPLNIMGVRKGKYAEDLPVTLRYERYDSGWHLVKILH
jgi:hypothetical protein